MEIELLEPDLYSSWYLDINKYQIESPIKDKLESLDKIKVFSYDYGGFQFGSFNENLGDGRSAQFILEGKLINFKGIGSTKYTTRGLDGYISDKELSEEQLKSYYLKELGIDTVELLGYMRNKENNKKVLIRRNETWIRLGMLHKYVIEGNEKWIDSIRKSIYLLYSENNSCNCYKILINKWIDSIYKILENRVCHGSFSSDNLLIDGKILDIGKALINKKGEGNFQVRDRDYYCFNNQLGLLKIYLEHTAPIFKMSRQEGRDLIEDLLNIRE